MSEGGKRISCFLLLGSLVVLAFATLSKPDSLTTPLFWGSLTTAVGVAVLYLIIPKAKDKHPDYLYESTGDYFERNGLCLNVTQSEEKGNFLLNLWYQSRFNVPCECRFLLMHHGGLFGRGSQGAIVFQFDCKGAEFGVVRKAVGVPRELQGRKVAFDIGCSVRMTVERGKRLRVRNATAIGNDAQLGNTPNLGDAILNPVAAVARAASNNSLKLSLPMEVAESQPNERNQSQVTLWVPDDPELPLHELLRERCPELLDA